MTHFSSTCPACQAFINKLPVSSAVLHVPTVGSMRVHYHCPKCDTDVEQDVSNDLGEVLTSKGMPTERVDVVIPSQHKPGPAITWDDLIEFGMALEAADDVV